MDIRIAVALTILYFVIGGLFSIAFTNDPNDRVSIAILWPIWLALIILLLPIFTLAEFYARIRDRGKK